MGVVVAITAVSVVTIVVGAVLAWRLGVAHNRILELEGEVAYLRALVWVPDDRPRVVARVGDGEEIRRGDCVVIDLHGRAHASPRRPAS